MLKDRVFSIIVALFLIVMFMETFNFPVKSSWQLYGSADYPRVVILIVGVLTFLMLIKSFFGERINRGKTEWKTLIKKYGRALLVVLFTGIYIIVLPEFGFIWSSILYLSILHATLIDKINLKNTFLGIMFSVSASLIIFLIFDVFLNVSLP